MAKAKVSRNLEALPTLKMILIGASLNEVLTSYHPPDRSSQYGNAVLDFPAWPRQPAPALKFKDVALQSGLRAAWATPIMSLDGKVLGTFGMYYREVRQPGPGEIQLIDYASRIAGIAIERDQSHAALTRA